MDEPHTRPRARVRELYTEHERQGRLIGVISDPDADDAWIQSTLTVDVEP